MRDVPRVLDLMDKHQIKLSSFMISRAVEKAPDLAREIVKRGHEAAAHGRTWQNSYFLDPEAEWKFIAESVETIQKVTDQQPIGWNAYWMRNSPHTLDILQSLGSKYHIDEPGIAEPFIVKLKEGDFGTVPYTFHTNDTQGQSSSSSSGSSPNPVRTRPSNGHAASVSGTDSYRLGLPFLFASQEPPPALHECAARPKHVGPLVGPLGGVFDLVRQRRLGQVARNAVVGAPASE